jgi:hypothetical protein
MLQRVIERLQRVAPAMTAGAAAAAGTVLLWIIASTDSLLLGLLLCGEKPAKVELLTAAVRAKNRAVEKRSSEKIGLRTEVAASRGGDYL